MKLRSMCAQVHEYKEITLELDNGEYVHLYDCLVLESYSSIVAVYCKMQLFLLPRYDYSVTTWKHLHAFIQDYCSFVRDLSAKDMRKAAETRANNGEYIFANGWLSPSGMLWTH
jgi:hypothetical protein